MKKFFEGQMFTPTKWDESGETKAEFGNKLLDFILSGFQKSKFTDKLYTRLSMCFGNIAHYDRSGFWATWFETPEQRADFIKHMLSYPCFGQPEFTYCDVERAIQAEVRKLNLAQALQNKADDATSARELVMLDALQKKYRPASIVPIPVAHIIKEETGEQLSLLAC